MYVANVMYLSWRLILDRDLVAPHLGHLHSLVLADTFARFAKLRKPARQLLLTTGTDEHGLKIQQAAKNQGVGEQEFCDLVSETFKVSRQHRREVVLTP